MARHIQIQFFLKSGYLDMIFLFHNFLMCLYLLQFFVLPLVIQTGR